MVDFRGLGNSPCKRTVSGSNPLTGSRSEGLSGDLLSLPGAKQGVKELRSHGEQQRVAIARAIACQPPIRSLMSADGVPIEEIERLAGQNQTSTTELVYRHELRPVITTGAEGMDRVLSRGRP